LTADCQQSSIRTIREYGPYFGPVGRMYM